MISEPNERVGKLEKWLRDKCRQTRNPQESEQKTIKAKACRQSFQAERRSGGLLSGCSQLNRETASPAQAGTSSGGKFAAETRLVELCRRSAAEGADMTQLTILQADAERPGIRRHATAGNVHDAANTEAGGKLQFL